MALNKVNEQNRTLMENASMDDNRIAVSVQVADLATLLAQLEQNISAVNSLAARISTIEQEITDMKKIIPKPKGWRKWLHQG